jgi:hypothetical protein
MEMELLIVTRDKTGQIALWKYKNWLLRCLEMDIAGMWEYKNVQAITEDIETHVFKAIFGYTPRKGTKGLLEYKIISH